MNDEVKRVVTVEIEDVRGKRVELRREGDTVKIQSKAFKVSPISIENLRQGLRELGVE